MSKFAPINKGILGKKIGTSSFFNEDGIRMPVTILEVGPCHLVQKKNVETDGYSSIQLGFQDKKEKKVKKPENGHFKKAGVKAKRFLKEFKFCDKVYDFLKVGNEISVEQFQVGDFVDVTSKSKGKGFAGVMKRYHFAGGTSSHGTHESFRGTGSIGMCQTPGRVFKGRKMPGHMGSRTSTVQNLRVVKVDVENRLLYLLGTVPGSTDSLIMVRDSVKKPSLPYYGKNETKEEEKTTEQNN